MDNPSQSNTIAFFDLDGTLTRKDSFVEFIKFHAGFVKFIYGLIVLSPTLFAYAIGIIPNFSAKEKVFTFFFKGMTEEDLITKGEEFCLQVMPKILNSETVSRLEYHQSQKHTTVVVTASLQHYVKPWCDKNNVAVIATIPDVQNNIITGRLSSKNCYGPEKVNRIREHFDLSEYKQIHAYGDSRGDYDMLELAHHPYYKGKPWNVKQT
ncbi:MAG: HAD-IB family hydrolase [Candidatus Omnitrophica bacterium]|nr:HAD-IB family hydrolase [Candidatus Omnitrophota bacterium]